MDFLSGILKVDPEKSLFPGFQIQKTFSVNGPDRLSSKKIATTHFSQRKEVEDEK
jgi:hypothetical protein